MTTITATAPAGARSGPRWPLLWVAWRRHRLGLIAFALVAAALAARLIITGLPVHAAYAGYVAHHCVTGGHAICATYQHQLFDPNSWVTSYAGMVIVPILAGVFLGAPLLAREFEAGTHRFAGVQGHSIRRQFAVRLVLFGAVVTVGCCVLGLLSQWSLAPFHRIALGYDTGLPYWQPGFFNITGVTLPGWALFDFGVGVLAGALIRRTVPAMGVACAAGIAAAALGTGIGVLGSGGALTKALLSVSPAATRAVPALYAGGWAGGRPGKGLQAYPNAVPQNIYLVGNGWFTGPNGQRLSAAATQAALNRIPARVASSRGPLRSWFGAHHLSYWYSFQPADRFWLFQAAAAAILIALAALAASLAVWWAGRPG